MKILATVRGWWRKLFKRPAKRDLFAELREGLDSIPRRPKKQRYSGCKSRPYIDRPLKYRHVSRPLYFNGATGRVEAVPKGQGVTYYRPKVNV